MFDIGWSELLLIGVVALIVVGPKDLPGMFRALGRLTAKARSMAREFSRAMEEAADESGLKDAAGDLKDLKGLTSKKSLGLDTLEKATEKFEKWEPKLPASKSGAQPDPDAPAAKPETAAAPAPTPAPAEAKKPTAKPQAKKSPAKSGTAAKSAAKPAAKKTAAKKATAGKGDA